MCSLRTKESFAGAADACCSRPLAGGLLFRPEQESPSAAGVLRSRGAWFGCPYDGKQQRQQCCS
jgi:hypothetical protein